MTLRFLARPERAEIAPLARARVLLARVQPVFSRFQLANHARLLTGSDSVHCATDAPAARDAGGQQAGTTLTVRPAPTDWRSARLRRRRPGSPHRRRGPTHARRRPRRDRLAKPPVRIPLLAGRAEHDARVTDLRLGMRDPASGPGQRPSSVAPIARRGATRRARSMWPLARLDRRSARLTAPGAADRALDNRAEPNGAVDRARRGQSTPWPERPRERARSPRLTLPCRFYSSWSPWSRTSSTGLDGPRYAAMHETDVLAL
jgi:hypothetical protein